MPLIGAYKSDRFPQEDVRIRRSLARPIYVPFIGATQDVDLGTYSLTTTGVMTATRLISTAAIGIAPLTITSTDLVVNLNADLVDGHHASEFVPYTGATTNVALGVHTLTCGPLTTNSGLGDGVGLSVVEVDYFSGFPMMVLQGSTSSGPTSGFGQTGGLFIFGDPSGIGGPFPSLVFLDTTDPVNIQSSIQQDGSGNFLFYAYSGLTQFNGVVQADFLKTATPPIANSTGTVALVAKDANLLTANAGWIPMKRSDGTEIYLPYWL
jgi:hypothetical protein